VRGHGGGFSEFGLSDSDPPGEPWAGALDEEENIQLNCQHNNSQISPTNTHAIIYPNNCEDNSVGATCVNYLQNGGVTGELDGTPSQRAQSKKQSIISLYIYIYINI